MTIRHGRVRVRVSEAVQISPQGERHWFPRLFQMPDGSLFQFNVVVDDATGALKESGSGAGRVSRDGGETWQEVTVPPHFAFPVNLGGGRARSFSYILWQDKNGKPYGRAYDWDAAYGWSNAQIYTIDIAATRDKIDGVSGIAVDRTVMREADGSLLATVYGTWQDAAKYGCFLIRSTDEGKTWSYLSTIAFDPTHFSREGYCEPVMAHVADGSLLSVIRTGGGTDPMFQARSLDHGQTWSEPENLGVLSVDPDLCLMSNGILVCSYGRPTMDVMFSLDGNGETWTKPITVFRGNSTCYSGIREVAPGRLLLVYDSNPTGSPWEAHNNQINAVFLDVTLT